MHEFTRNVPAESDTTWLLGQEFIADCMALLASDEPLPKDEAFSVVQIVVRLGIPPGIPVSVQSIAREGLMMPDQACALSEMGSSRITRKIKNRFFIFVPF